MIVKVLSPTQAAIGTAEFTVCDVTQGLFQHMRELEQPNSRSVTLLKVLSPTQAAIGTAAFTV